MGMRASISYVEKTGKTFVTTSQWSTRLDQAIGHHAHSEMVTGVPVNEAVRNLFKQITTNHGHISALEIGSPDNLLSVHDVTVGASAVIVNPQEEASTFSSESVAADLIKGHLNGGSIGAIYRESNPSVIEFFWEDEETEEIVKENHDISELAEFYSDVFGNPQKLQDMSFRI